MNVAIRVDWTMLLPKGWRTCSIGDIVREAQPGFATSSRSDNGTIQLRMNNVTTSGEFDWTSFIRVPASSSEVERFSLEPGDLVFNNTNSAELVGKSALVMGFKEPVVYSNHFTRLRFREAAHPRYVALWLLYMWRSGTFEEICNRWVGQAAVPSKKLFSLQIPLPPLPVQRRIAAALDAQMAEIARARAAAERQIQDIRRLFLGFLTEAFQELKNTRSKVDLGEIGHLGPSKSLSKDGDAEVQAVTTACLTEHGFSPGGIKTGRMATRDVKFCILQPGEILVARSNTPELVGRASIYKGQPDGVVASDLTIRLWIEDKVTRVYTARYLAYLFVSGYWIEHAGGASGSMKKITRTQLLGLQIPIPARRVQDQLVHRLAEAERIHAKASEAACAQIAILDALPTALLRAAFRGGI